MPTPLASPKPNQQQIVVIKGLRESSPEDSRALRLTQLGAQLRQELQGWTLPLLIVQSSCSLLRGTASVEDWGLVLSQLRCDDPGSTRDRRGENHPAWGGAGGAVQASLAALDEARSGATAGVAVATPATPMQPAMPAQPWALLADHQDLLGLPRALDRWGHGHVAVGATLELEVAGLLLVLVAPTRRAYARLCRVLSWRLEEPLAWKRWLDRQHPGPDLSDLVCLVDNEAWGDRVRELGGEACRRSGGRPLTTPSTYPVVAAPLFAHIDAHDRLAAPVLEAIRERGTVRRDHAAALALADLPRVREAFRGYEEQLAAGAALLARCRYAPGPDDDHPQAIQHLPPRLPDVDNDDPLGRLRSEALLGLQRRYGEVPPQAAHERLDHELQVIADKHFASYVLAVWHLARGKRTCGRGSAASSIVCYCLGLTNVDPLRYHLLFERFLAPERTDPPDIDIDFPWDERDHVLAETIAQYGWEHVAMVATHQTMHRWSALREAARAYGMPDSAITRVRDRLQSHERYGTALEDSLEEPWPTIFRTVAIIAGSPRHLGVHCGGVVMTGIPIRELAVVHPAAKTVPLAWGEEAPQDIHVPTVSWEKDGCEDLGLVKIDFLSNRSLAVIRDCIADIAAQGEPLMESTWRPDLDEPTRELIASGNTMGCFYIESPAMRQLQAKVGSGDFDRLVVHSSIIRPAANAWINTYIARYHRFRISAGAITPAEEAEWYPHPVLKGLLSESFGILSYQEDVMLVAQELAGFGSREANQLRKALGRADTPLRLRSLVARFHDGCVQRDVPATVIELVWSMIASFAGYSFCKAHSASYAMVSFQCAYLKAHHPAAFLARVIANEGGYYPTCAYVEEARRLQVSIRGPCVLESAWKTGPEGHHALRLGLHLVRGLSRRSAEAVVAERSRQAFLGLRDLKLRCRIAAEELRALDDAGALDQLLPDASASQRSFLVGVVAREVDAFIHPSTQQGQQLLDLLAQDQHDPPLPILRDPARTELARRRFAALGVLPQAHPLSLWRLPRRTCHCRDITPAREHQRLSVIAWSITRKQVAATYFQDGQGNALEQPRFESMAFVTMEDETALVETVWFPDCYRRHGALLERDEPLRLSGRVTVEHGVATLTVERVERIVAPEAMEPSP